jgi:hypothetical protein
MVRADNLHHFRDNKESMKFLLLSVLLLSQISFAAANEHLDEVTHSGKIEIDKLVAKSAFEVNSVVILLTDKKDYRKINTGKLRYILSKAPASNITDSRKNRLISAQSVEAFKKVLTGYPNETMSELIFTTFAND